MSVHELRSWLLNEFRVTSSEEGKLQEHRREDIAPGQKNGTYHGWGLALLPSHN